MHNLKNNDKDILVTRYMANLNIKLNSLIPSHFKLDKKIKKKKRYGHDAKIASHLTFNQCTWPVLAGAKKKSNFNQQKELKM